MSIIEIESTLQDIEPAVTRATWGLPDPDFDGDDLLLTIRRVGK